MCTHAVAAVPSTVTQARRVAQCTQTFEFQKKMLYLLVCSLDNRVLVPVLVYIRVSLRRPSRVCSNLWGFDQRTFIGSGFHLSVQQ